MYWLLLVATTAPLPTTVARIDHDPAQVSLLVRENVVVMHGVFATEAQCQAEETRYDHDRENTAFCVMAR